MTHLTTNIFDTKFKISTISNPSVQETFNHTTFVDITGSQIDYTPSAGASFVIYEYNFYQTQKAYGKCTVMRYKLLESSDGSNWSDYGNKTDIVIGRGNYYNQGWAEQLRFCLDASSWTTKKYFKIQGRHNTEKTTESNYWNNSRLHQLRSASTPNSASGPWYYNTSVSCESVP